MNGISLKLHRGRVPCSSVTGIYAVIWKGNVPHGESYQYQDAVSTDVNGELVLPFTNLASMVDDVWFLLLYQRNDSSVKSSRIFAAPVRTVFLYADTLGEEKPWVEMQTWSETSPWGNP